MPIVVLYYQCIHCLFVTYKLNCIMQNYRAKVGEPVMVLATAGNLIANAETSQANALLDDLLANLDPQDDITKLCAQALRYRNQTDLPMYLRDLEEDDKQINVFDLVLRSVPPVQVVSVSALHVMRELYSSGLSSFTHLNIGIGKGHFETKLLEDLAQLSPDRQPQYIRIIGIDIDNDSLRETGKSILHLSETLFPESTVIEYVPIFAFAEAITDETWEAIRSHNTDALGVVSAFTLHHIPTQDQRQAVLNHIAVCAPSLFVLLEPDVDHFTPNLAERVVNCWNLFGKIFELVDQNELSEAEAHAIKYKFFGREIEDILSNKEHKRSEKHEPAHRWANRLEKAQFKMHRLIPSEGLDALLNSEVLEVTHNIKQKFLSTRYKNVPLVAMFTASQQL